MDQKIKGLVLGSLVTAVAALVAPSAGREATQVTRQFALDIPAQDLNTALIELADITGTQILYSADTVRGLRSNVVRGRYSAEQALRELLSGTGYVFRFTNGNAITLEKAPDAAGARAAGPVRIQPKGIE